MTSRSTTGWVNKILVKNPRPMVYCSRKKRSTTTETENIKVLTVYPMVEETLIGKPNQQTQS